MEMDTSSCLPFPLIQPEILGTHITYHGQPVAMQCVRAKSPTLLLYILYQRPENQVNFSTRQGRKRVNVNSAWFQTSMNEAFNGPTSLFILVFGLSQMDAITDEERTMD